MRKGTLQLLLSGLALAWFQPAFPAQPYITIGAGYGGDEIGGSVAGINHPTRCDRLLYANPADAPRDAACLDSTSRTFFEGAFDLGGGFLGSASAGFAWRSWRVEAEFLTSTHEGAVAPAIAAAGNTALQDKASEWSPAMAPQYQVSDFNADRLFLNLQYTFGTPEARWRPFVGLGLGLANIKTDFHGIYLRATVADGYVTAVGGDPAQPEAWQVAAAGTASIIDVEVGDTVFGYQLIAGLERALTDRASLLFASRHSAFRELRSNDLWTTLRSHAPVQADGTTPFRTDQTLDDIGGVSGTVALRYAF